MGIELEKFVNTIDDDLKCSICYGVLDNAVQLVECEHTFCADCIEEWIKRQSNCPIDRGQITTESLRPASRLLNNFLSRLQMKCDFSQFGCNSIITLDSLVSHTNECSFNPEKQFPCDKGCGVLLNMRQKLDHNCVLEDILINIGNQNEKIKKIEKIMEMQNKRIDLLQRKCDKTGELERKYQSLENKYDNLIAMLSATKLSSIENCDKIISNGENKDNEENKTKTGNRSSFRQSLGLNLLSRSTHKASIKQKLGPMRTVNITVDHNFKTIEMWANMREPIRNLKSRIREQENLSIDSQCLLYGEQQLENDKTLEDYSINSMDFILVKRPIKIDIILFADNISYLLEPFDTIGELKDRIQKSKGFNVSLSYFGQILEENRTFYSYKIRDRAKLKVSAIECNKDGSQCNGSHKHS